MSDAPDAPLQRTLLPLEVLEAETAVVGVPHFSGLEIHVVTVTGAPATIDFRIRRDTVEIWCEDHLAGVAGRNPLRTWLAAPTAELRVDDVVLNLDRIVDRHGRVAVSLPGVDAWTLAPLDLEALQQRV